MQFLNQKILLNEKAQDRDRGERGRNSQVF